MKMKLNSTSEQRIQITRWSAPRFSVAITFGRFLSEDAKITKFGGHAFPHTHAAIRTPRASAHRITSEEVGLSESAI